MKKYLTLILAVALCATSCDFLDRTPKDTLSPESYFRTETDLQLFSNSFYYSLFDQEIYEEQSDEYVCRTLSNVLRGGTYRTVPDTGGGWSWSVLRKINTLLGNINNCPDAALVEEYTGLARFFRAYFYFEKVKAFGDVPWVEKELGSADPLVFGARDSREFVMRKMLEDVDYAIEHLPSAVSVYRVNKWAALALKARFCLYEGTYMKYHSLSFPDDPDAHDAAYYLNQAADAALLIMQSGKYKLYSTGKPNVDYRTLFTEVDADKGEYLLAIKFDKGLELFNNTTAYSFWSSQGSVGMTKKAVDRYLMKDGSRFTDIPEWESKSFKDEIKDRDPRLAQSVITPGFSWASTSKSYDSPKLDETMTGFQPIKFVMDLKDKALNDDVNRSDRSYNDLPVFRFGEVLLNYAEAKAELGTLTQDDIDKSIKLIRDRVGMGNLNMSEANANPDWYLTSEKYGYANVTGTNKGVILEIRRERSVELAQEGFRLSDLCRWKEGKCINQQLYGMYIPGPGEYDLSGDGKPDLCIYKGNDKPTSVSAYIWKIGEDIILSDGDKGFFDPYQKTSHEFNEERDYLYPVPINDRSLNKNLAQNPGWDDGLGY
ncbi:MAG: RagB/SusD family nutrient uptake outer membrane protein [Bacteroidales bacterium]